MEKDYFTIKESSFIDYDINPSSYLWKFLSIEKFLSLIIHEEFHLTRLDLFDDKQEAISLEYLEILSRQEFLQKNTSLGETFEIVHEGEKQNELHKEHEIMQKSNFASCWYLAEDESENVAMWNLYSSSNSVAIKIRYNDFKRYLLKHNTENRPKNDFEELHFSKIHYCSFNNPKTLENNTDINVVFLKDKSFDYEREFRIIAKKAYKKAEYNPPKEDRYKIRYDELHKNTSELRFIKLKLKNFKEYPFKIIFHPKCPDWIKNDLKEIIKKFEYNFEYENSIVKLR